MEAKRGGGGGGCSDLRACNRDPCLNVDGGDIHGGIDNVEVGRGGGVGKSHRCGGEARRVLEQVMEVKNIK